MLLRVNLALKVLPRRDPMTIEHAKTLHGETLHINFFDYPRNTITCDFFNLAFQISVFLVINRSTRVTKTRVTIIKHIFTNSIIDLPFHGGFVKTDISDNFVVGFQKIFKE